LFFARIQAPRPAGRTKGAQVSHKGAIRDLEMAPALHLLKEGPEDPKRRPKDNEQPEATEQRRRCRVARQDALRRDSQPDRAPILPRIGGRGVAAAAAAWIARLLGSVAL
jgi:hypothetical protein